MRNVHSCEAEFIGRLYFNKTKLNSQDIWTLGVVDLFPSPLPAFLTKTVTISMHEIDPDQF